jgi:hypothetical protein
VSAGVRTVWSETSAAIRNPSVPLPKFKTFIISYVASTQSLLFQNVSTANASRTDDQWHKATKWRP